MTCVLCRQLFRASRFTGYYDGRPVCAGCEIEAQASLLDPSVPCDQADDAAVARAIGRRIAEVRAAEAMRMQGVLL